MTKEEAIMAMFKGKAVRHMYFEKNEYMRYENGVYVFEDGVKCSPTLFWIDRKGPNWKDDWELYPCCEECNTPLKPAPAKSEDLPTYVGYLPCNCNNQTHNLKSMPKTINAGTPGLQKFITDKFTNVDTTNQQLTYVVVKAHHVQNDLLLGFGFDSIEIIELQQYAHLVYEYCNLNPDDTEAATYYSELSKILAPSQNVEQ